ncbi:MAG TPA: sigma-70 family RNA polymerase sigma factor [Aquihabitans sp.]|jgi:RNA polymerase sigma factor (sigma-70 family)|nr:sigma-70 family RNA polymerase sigma factor [Aquihabitans sp.]
MADDAALIDQVRHGHAQAYATLWGRHRREAHGYARSLVPHGDVDDVVAEAFAKVLSAIRTGRGPTDRFAPYLMVAVRSVAFSEHRRRARTTVGDPAPIADHPHPDHDDALTAALADLSPRHRTALWLGVVEGRSPAEIGAALHISGPAASALLYRARNALRTAYHHTTTEDRALTA